MNRIKKITPYLMIVLFVASAGIFIANKGFKYSDYQNAIKVQVSGEKDVEAFVEKLRSSEGLVELDRANNAAYYQHVDQKVVEDNIANVKKDYPEVLNLVQNIYPSISKKDVAINLALISGIISILFVVYSFVLKTRFYKWKFKEYAKYYGFYLFDTLMSATILAGAISLLSLVYKINDYVLYSFFALLIVKTLIFWFKLLQEDIHKMKYAYVENFKNDYKYIFVVLFVLLALLTVGMGVKSVIPLGFIVVAVLISALCDYSILTFEFPRFRRSLNNNVEPVKKEKVKKDLKGASEKQYIPNPKLKKKNRKK